MPVRPYIVGQKTAHDACKTPTYQVWMWMKRRCVSRREVNHHGRGICVCNRWLHDFAAFRSDMGERPSPAHEIDRIDNDGNYEPGNCRWVTRSENCRNRRSSRWIEFRGERKTIAEWSELFGIHRGTIRRRLEAGRSVDRALTLVPIHKPRH